MSLVVEPDVHQPDPPTGPGDGGSGDGEPWWHARWRLLVLGVALVLLGMAAGYAITSRSADDAPSASSADVGFLQDMRWHHDQAVRMGLIMLAKEASEQDTQVRSMATDIVRAQQFEAGVMAGQLRSWGQAEANDTGTGMRWMGMPVPLDRMPGVASDEDLDRLKAATGREADVLFLQLMAAHHEGGLQMATDALGRATTEEARTLARTFLTSQEFELAELRGRLRQLGA